MKNLVKVLRAAVKYHSHLQNNYPEILNKPEMVYENAHGRFPRRLLVRVNDLTLEFSSPGTIPLLFIYKEIFKDLCYLAPGWTVENCFGPEKTVLDIGANIGFFSVWAAIHGCTVYAVEPNPCNFFWLLKNASKNNQEHKILANNLAISGENGTQELFVAEQFSGSSLIEEQSVGSRFSTLVRAETLGDFLRKVSNPNIDFLKMDCEGCEYEVLLSSEPESLSKIKRIALELHTNRSGYSLTDIQDHLVKCGFEVTVRESQGLFRFMTGVR